MNNMNRRTSSSAEIQRALRAAKSRGCKDCAEKQAEIERLRKKPCEWRIHDEDYGIWEGSCGAYWNFEEGGPRENKMAFCPECGGDVVLIEAQAEEGER